ncbi:MAG TPA: hypothetical protein HA260_00075 [Thermoplasmata archaeon]|nr:hypothetical protein [Thermoplasmata archaeon]
MKKGMICVFVFMLVMMTIPVGVGQNNYTIEDSKESAQTLFYSMAKISWNMSSTRFELVKVDFLARCLPGIVDAYGLDVTLGTPLGNLIFFMGSKWNVTEGSMILSPIGMKMVSINPGDTIRWLFVLVFMTADDYNHHWVSGRAFGVIVEKA